MKTFSLRSFTFFAFSSLFILLHLTSCSSARKISKDTRTILQTAPPFEQGFVGFALYDPEENEFIYEYNSEKYFTPASNTKLFTFYTGVKILGDSLPALKYTVSNDSLFFWGTGDPSFLHRDFPYSRVLEFLEDRDEQLVYTAPNYTEKHFGPGWAWSDYNWYYSVERGAFPVHGNYTTLKFDPLDSLPGTAPSFFKDSLRPEPGFTGKSSGATRDLLGNRFAFRHQRGNKSRNQDIPFKYSDQLVVDLLSDTLNKEIILKTEVPESFHPVKTLYSVPSDSVYKRMLQVSDNFIAEQLLMMSAGELTDTLKTDIAIDYMQEHYLKDLPDEPQWVDGSGLSRYNLFTPRSVVKLLEKIRKEVPQERLFELLPAGGRSGTLRNSYEAEEPYIFAKTGTLSNNHSLSGYLRSKKGKVLIFSFMNSNYTVPSSEVKKEMENILRNVYLNF